MKNKKLKKDCMISVRVDRDLFNRYEKCAERLHVSNAALQEEALRVFIEMAEKNDYLIPWPPTAVLSHQVIPTKQIPPPK